MLAMLNFLNAHNFSISQPILMILQLLSKFMIHRALNDKAYLSLALLSPLMIPSKKKKSFFFPNSADWDRHTFYPMVKSNN